MTALMGNRGQNGVAPVYTNACLMRSLDASPAQVCQCVAQLYHVSAELMEKVATYIMTVKLND